MERALPRLEELILAGNCLSDLPSSGFETVRNEIKRKIISSAFIALGEH